MTPLILNCSKILWHP